MRVGAITTLGVVASILAGAGSADAAVRYASPSGTASADCPAAAPCGLVTAVNAAVSGDEVIVLPGAYPVSAGLQVVSPSVNVHGQEGQPRPVITTSAFTGIVVSDPTSRVANLEIDHSNSNAAILLGGLGERLLVRGGSSHACYVAGTLRDSICHSRGTGNGIILSSGSDATAKLRNVTAISNTTEAIWAYTSVAGVDVAVEGTAVIAQGSVVSGSDSDIRASASNATATAAVTLDHSNFDTAFSSGSGTETISAPGSPTNQIASPLLSPDFHQAVGSPTIDAGVLTAESGASDIDGDPRSLGLAPDIGADEFVPPDTAGPDLRLSGKRKQPLGKRVFVKVSCADEACAASASGTLVVKADKKRSFKLKAVSRSLAVAEKRKLKLKLPKRARKAAEKALEAAGKAKAKIVVAAVDAAANSASAKRAVRLR